MTTNAERLEAVADRIVEAADAAGIGVFVLSREGLRSKALYVSDAAVDVLGRPREELMETSPFELLAPAERDRIEDMSVQILRGESVPLLLETTALRPDGTRVPLEVSQSHTDLDGKPISVCFIVDLTERKQVEAALRRSEERFRALVESSPQPIWIYDGKQLLYANASATRLFGYDAEEALRLNPTKIVHPDDVSAVEERTRAVMTKGEQVPPYEYRARRRDGSTLHIEVSSIGIRYANNPAVLSFGRDVTARKHHELQLLQADRLAALGLLAGGMAHAINNPLTYVLLNLQHLSHKLPGALQDPATRDEALVRMREAHQGAERVANVVKQMRALSRPDDVRRPVSLRTVLDVVVQMVGNEIRHRGDLITELDDVPPVYASEAQLEQVFLNLLIHAARSLPESSGESNVVRLALRADDADRVVVEVSNSGPGVDSEQMARLFDPLFGVADFESTPDVGLAICKGIIDSLGGEMKVESSAEQGTTFRVFFPAGTGLSPSEPYSREIEPVSTPAPRVESARILVVDDDPGVGSALRLMLEDQHEVTCVESGREALRVLLHDDDFDVVFCDLMMPELGGTDLFEALRFNRPGLERRLVFMTGGAFTTAAERFLAQVPNARIEKPFDLRTLQRLVRRAMARR